MTLWEIILLILAATAVFASTVYGIQMRQVMARLERMLDDAMHGQFRESQYDETHLSRLEAKFGQFLSASSLSRERIETDRKNLTETIGDISHQTKTPIANMVLYTQLLLEQDLSPEAHELAAQIGAQGEKLDSLIQSLVKTSRLETGVITPTPVSSDIGTLFGELERGYTPAAQAKGVTLCFPEKPSLFAAFDPKWTAEAVGNIIHNAIKYTSSGGSVTVSCQSYELFCRINVTDTGIGIPEEEQARIFQRFYRGSQVRQEDGVGVGLYLSRQIITAQGGYIKVQSTSGKGSIFSVFLPT